MLSKGCFLCDVCNYNKKTRKKKIKALPYEKELRGRCWEAKCDHIPKAVFPIIDYDTIDNYNTNQSVSTISNEYMLPPKNPNIFAVSFTLFQHLLFCTILFYSIYIYMLFNL